MKRREFLTKASVASAVLAGVPLTDTLAKPTRADEQEEDKPDRNFSWNIGTPAVAKAADGSTITLTGTGTFIVGDADEVTGGGTWKLSGGAGGTFRVTSLIRFDLARGSVPARPDFRAGLAFLRIAYSDGSRGILVASCHLPGTPDSVFEGATASKDFSDYGCPVSGTQVFIVRKQDDE